MWPDLDDEILQRSQQVDQLTTYVANYYAFSIVTENRIARFILLILELAPPTAMILNTSPTVSSFALFSDRLGPVWLFQILTVIMTTHQNFPDSKRNVHPRTIALKLAFQRVRSQPERSHL